VDFHRRVLDLLSDYICMQERTCKIRNKATRCRDTLQQNSEHLSSSNSQPRKYFREDSSSRIFFFKMHLLKQRNGLSLWDIWRNNLQCHY